MNSELRVPAAQYLRMSTEHQQYSVENQSIAIQVYAESHGFEVVETYSDVAKSGLVLKYRAGLRQLLQDVVSGKAAYRAILVYDVSRWGRFQDTDESAHYEFLCKSAGVPVHYCAEQFANDGSLPSLIMKALKRTMAGEYSRELSAKVFAGQKRLVLLGFKTGGLAGYGLRRMLISPSGVHKHELTKGERKSITTDRVILVPGPPHEVQIVRDIYRMHITERRSMSYIARWLNSESVARPGHARWDHSAIKAILTHPKYAGCSVFGRVAKKLNGPLVKVPRSEWTVKPGAFETLVDPETFAAAQRALSSYPYQRTDEDMLNDLRALLASQGRLSLKIIKSAPHVKAPGTYRKRFGNLRSAYRLVGYDRPDRLGGVETRCRTMAIQKGLVSRIAAMFPNQMSIVRPGVHWRARLLFARRVNISVLVVRSALVYKNTRHWVVEPVLRERNFTTLMARLDEDNREILDFHVFSKTGRPKRFDLSLNDPWLDRGEQLADLSQLIATIEKVRKLRSS